MQGDEDYCTWLYFRYGRAFRGPPVGGAFAFSSLPSAMKVDTEAFLADEFGKEVRSR